MPDIGSLIVLGVLVLLLVVPFQRFRRQQREMAATQSEVEPGRRVMMTSGVYGDIVSVHEDDDTVVLEVAPGVHMTWARQAVARVVEPETPLDPPETSERVTPEDETPQDEPPQNP